MLLRQEKTKGVDKKVQEVGKDKGVDNNAVEVGKDQRGMGGQRSCRGMKESGGARNQPVD